MSVKLRLMRFGKKNRPCYRVCVVDTRAPRDGAYIESLGFYDPYIADDRKKVQINKERAEYWLSVGATPSETVGSFLRMLSVTGLSHPKKARKKRPAKKLSKEERQRKAEKKEKRKVRRVAQAKAKAKRKAAKADR